MAHNRPILKAVDCSIMYGRAHVRNNHNFLQFWQTWQHKSNSKYKKIKQSAQKTAASGEDVNSRSHQFKSSVSRIAKKLIPEFS